MTAINEILVIWRKIFSRERYKMRNSELIVFNRSVAPWQVTLAQELISGQETSLNLHNLSRRELYDVGYLALGNCMVNALNLRRSSPKDIEKFFGDTDRIIKKCELKRITFYLVGLRVFWLLLKHRLFGHQSSK
jgi:hypothetical protein